eukprot:NODE_5228_length_682_cov_26.079279_g5065_i0.p1 GENE.NODE_5228_length_682_cov_26.079279_g5065_i0~~NODE_5228_length_682_cov_26.079279_g5065_i0.p1  ORF type:complete len:142 (+),score=29.90 NODE_5228_length_682_cov_26.079279_g5065_i0:41-427(+)
MSSSTGSKPGAPPPKRTALTGKQLFKQRLVSAEGLPALLDRIKHTPFKGSGHEASNLKTLLWHFRDWQHNLFPRMKFDAFVDHTCVLKNLKFEIQALHADVNPTSGQTGDADVRSSSEPNAKRQKLSE